MAENKELQVEVADLTDQLNKCNEEMQKLGGEKREVVKSVVAQIKRYIKQHLYRTIKFHDGSPNAIRCITDQVYNGIKDEEHIAHAMEELDEDTFHCTHLKDIKLNMCDRLQCTQTLCKKATECECHQ